MIQRGGPVAGDCPHRLVIKKVEDMSRLHTLPLLCQRCLGFNKFVSPWNLIKRHLKSDSTTWQHSFRSSSFHRMTMGKRGLLRVISVLNPYSYTSHVGTCSSYSSSSSGNDSSKHSSDSMQDTGNYDLEAKLRNDPEVKAWLQHLNEDFAAGENKTSGGQVFPDQSDSDASDSDSSESGTSDSNTSGSDTSDSDSGADRKDAAADKDEGSTPKTITAEEVDAELMRYDYEEFEAFDEDTIDERFIEDQVEEVHPISLSRGQTGVFDIEEMVEVLTVDNAKDICVIGVPKHMNYVDYMVIATGRSTRHLKAMAEYVKKLYKRKRGRGDAVSCYVEGLQSTDWLAMDLGNMAVHLFLADTRQVYDLETLWTVGSGYDDKLTKETDADPFAMFLDDTSPSVTQTGHNIAQSEHVVFENGQGHGFGNQQLNVQKGTMDSMASWHGNGSDR